MPYTAYSDIRTDVLDRAGQSTTDTSGDFYSTVGRQVDRAYQEICSAHPYLFLRAAPPGVLRTVAPITAGTVGVTNGSTAITFSSAPAVSVANREIIITGWNEVYRISAHTAGQAAATLDSAYNGTTNAAASYTVLQREYALASDVRHIVEMHVSDGGAVIEQKDEAWLLREYPDPPSSIWPPRYFARIAERRVRFDGYPDRTRRVEYAYTVIPANISDGVGSILIPLGSRAVIADGGLYWTYITIGDDKADAAGILYAAGRAALIEDDLRKRRTLGQPTNRRAAHYL